MRTRSRWSVSFIPLAVAFTACSDPNSSSTPLSFDEVPMAEEAETLAGELEEKGGSCPEGYFIIDVGIGGKADANLNGYACYNGTDSVIDDTLVVEGAETEFAGGHGNFNDFGKKGIQNVSFSFHGRQNKTMVVKGEFEFHDFANDLRLHGDVNCLIVEKNRAIVGGVVTQSTDAKLPVGSGVIWTTTDNGEGINAPVDFISRPMRVKSPKEGCKGKIAVPKETLLESGNIQVLH